jgi:hypothetical protein
MTKFCSIPFCLFLLRFILLIDFDYDLFFCLSSFLFGWVLLSSICYKFAEIGPCNDHPRASYQAGIACCDLFLVVFRCILFAGRSIFVVHSYTLCYFNARADWIEIYQFFDFFFGSTIQNQNQ